MSNLPANPPEKKIVRQFKPVSATELLNMDLPEPVPLLHPWLPRQGLAMIYAPRGVGKTFLASSITLALASGEELLGWKPMSKCRVLYIDGEMPAYTMKKRLLELQAMFSVQADMDNIEIITPDLTKDVLLNLSDFHDQLILESQLKNIDLIIVDNIATVCRGGRENDTDSWTVVQNWAISQRSKGRSVLFIHHAGKNGGQRGTSAREDVLDTVISLKRPKDYKQEHGCSFEIHFEKARNFSGESAQPIQARLIESESGFKWEFQALEDSTYQKVVALYVEGITSLNDIAAELDVNKSTVSRSLKKARELGAISS